MESDRQAPAQRPDPGQEPQQEPRPVELVPDADDLEALLEAGDETTIRRFLRMLHPADLALTFDKVDEDLWPRLVAQLTIGEISGLMEELDDHLRDDLAELLRRDQLVDIVTQPGMVECLFQIGNHTRQRRRPVTTPKDLRRAVVQLHHALRVQNHPGLLRLLPLHAVARTDPIACRAIDIAHHPSSSLK